MILDQKTRCRERGNSLNLMIPLAGGELFLVGGVAKFEEYSLLFAKNGQKGQKNSNRRKTSDYVPISLLQALIGCDRMKRSSNFSALVGAFEGEPCVFISSFNNTC